MSGQEAGDAEADRLLVMGQVAAPYGVQGWVHVAPWTAQQGGLLEYPVWYLRQRGSWRTVRVLQSRLHGKGLVVQLAWTTTYENRSQLPSFATKASS